MKSLTKLLQNSEFSHVSQSCPVFLSKCPVFFKKIDGYPNYNSKELIEKAAVSEGIEASV